MLDLSEDDVAPWEDEWDHYLLGEEQQEMIEALMTRTHSRTSES